MFYTQTCPQCEIYKPIYQKLAIHVKGVSSVGIAAMDLDENENIGTKLDIEVIPTLVYFKKGRKKEV
eukprot:TRINITY_DN5134_c0_g1_i1.p1 TRINITY_DN5134_c0_g1~~TRINITY_DN5134_c0_g1_i1.p1  ORF type:complete len:67 (-),score=6.35 TRINITY_DN5134_c0_g1_i1:146-346(-)